MLYRAFFPPRPSSAVSSPRPRRVLFAALCLAPQPEDLPGAFPDPSARPEDVPCSARLAVSEALERALFEMGMPSAVRLATVAARLPNAPRGDMLLLRWVAGDERAAALTLGEKRRHRAVKRFAVAEMRGAAEGSREDAQMDSGGEGQSAGHVRGRNWAVAVPPIPRAPQVR